MPKQKQKNASKIHMIVQKYFGSALAASFFTRTNLFVLAIVLAGVLMLTKGASAAECVFASTEPTNDWAIDANWSCGHVPLQADNVTVDIETVNITAESYANDVTIMAGATVNLLTNTLHVSGNWSIDLSLFDYGTGTIDFNGTSTQSITTNDGFANFHHLTVSKSAGELNSTSFIVLAGNFLSSGAHTINSAGFSVTGESVIGSGTELISTANVNFQSFASNAGSIGLGAEVDPAVSMTFYVSTTNNGTISAGSGLLSFWDVLHNSGGIINGQTGQVTFLGDVTPVGTFNPGTSEVRFAQGGIRNLPFDEFYDLTIDLDLAGEMHLFRDVTTTHNLTLSSGLEGTNDGTLFVGPYTLAVGGNVSINRGELNATDPDGRIYVGGDWNKNDELGTFSVLAPVYFNGSGDQNVQREYFSDLIVNKTGGSLIFNNEIEVNGGFTVTAGTVNVNNYILTANGGYENSGLIVLGETGIIFHALGSVSTTNALGEDVESIETPGSFYATVINKARNFDGTVEETIEISISSDAAAGSDLENLTLTETGPATGIFRNSSPLQVVAGTVVQENGRIEVEANGTATYTYTDPMNPDATGTSNVNLIYSEAGNPEPILSTISPTSKDLDASDLSVVLTGTDFISGSLVYFDNALRSSVFNSSTQITATLNSADVSYRGTHIFKVFNPTPGGGTSTSMTFTVVIPPRPPVGGSPSISVGPPVTSPTAPVITMGTSSEFAVSPIKIHSIGVEDLSLEWTVSSTRSTQGKVYGFYLPHYKLWIVPSGGLNVSSTVYTLGSRTYYQSIENWGPLFKIMGLDSETFYKFWVIGTKDPKALSQAGSWEFSATTTPGVIKFETEMKLIEKNTRPVPSPASALLSYLSPLPLLLSGATVLGKRRKRKSAWLSLFATALMISGLSLAAPIVRAAEVQTMTYQLNFKHTGTKTAKNVNVSNPIPQGTTYYLNSIQIDGAQQTDAPDQDNASYSANPAQVNFSWPTVAPGESHTMKFTVYLNEGTKSDQINNVATLQPPDNSDPNTPPIIIHEQSVCGNSIIEVKRDQNGNPIMSNGQAVWEACDDGANNGKGYGWCTADCSAVYLPSNLCGNGKLDEWTNLKTSQAYKETCDQGQLNGQPGNCNKTCNGIVPLPPKPPEPKEEEKQEVKPAEPSDAADVTTSQNATTSTVPVVEPLDVAAPSVETKPVVTPSKEAPDDGSIGNSLSDAAKSVSRVLSTPEVRVATIPVLGTVAAFNVVSSAGWISFLNYLYYIFTQPIMLFGRRKKQKYGVVYNSLSKLPLDLAAVRVKDGSGRIVQTKITDRQGRYNFLVPKGQYTLDISKPGYVFPTSLLSGKTQDVDYIDLLTNNKLSLGADSVISSNIPVDPKEDTRTPKEVKRKILFRRLQGGLAMLTTLLSVGALVLVPSYQYLGLAAFQVITYFVFRRMAMAKRPTSLGIIKDAKTGKAVKNAVVRILDAQFNRILETQVASSDGRYAFLVGKGKFYVTVTKEGYETLRSEVIDCGNAKGPVVIDKELRLKKTQVAQAFVRS